MHPPSFNFWRMILGASALIVLVACIYIFMFLLKIGAKSPTQSFIERKETREQETYARLRFNLVGPEAAPASIRGLARFGYQIMINTQKYAKEYAGDRLNCTNCHFAGGDTTDGPGGGLSLVGVTTKFPAYDSGAQKVIDLPQRINYCFERSMDGKAVPLDSELMLTLITYFQWIAKGLPIYEPVPWLGSRPLETDHKGDINHGRQLYHTYCALCHRDDGQGGPNVPPVWGEGSFNTLAGMNDPSIMASFIYWNMPYTDSTPVLTEEEAVDVTVYILSQPRPVGKLTENDSE